MIDKKHFWKTLVHPVSVELFENIIASHPVIIKVSRARKTKYGDFRSFRDNRKDVISVNGNLSESSFMMTLIHELAHKITWDEYGRSVEPHGKEWKHNMYLLLVEFVRKEVFPSALATAIKLHWHDWKAVTIRMTEVYMVLQSLEGKSLVPLETLSVGDEFRTEEGKHFSKKEDLRKYSVCISLENQKLYKVHKNLLVEVVI